MNRNKLLFRIIDWMILFEWMKIIMNWYEWEEKNIQHKIHQYNQIINLNDSEWLIGSRFQSYELRMIKWFSIKSNDSEMFESSFETNQTNIHINIDSSIFTRIFIRIETKSIDILDHSIYRINQYFNKTIKNQESRYQWFNWCDKT